MVFFSGGRDVDYDTTMKFLDLARASGAKNIGIIVEDPIGRAARPRPSDSSEPNDDSHLQSGGFGRRFLFAEDRPEAALDPSR